MAVTRTTATKSRVNTASAVNRPTAKKDPAKELATGFERMSVQTARKAATGHKEKANFFDNIAKQKEEATKAKK